MWEASGSGRVPWSHCLFLVMTVWEWKTGDGGWEVREPRGRANGARRLSCQAVPVEEEPPSWDKCPGLRCPRAGGRCPGRPSGPTRKLLAVEAVLLTRQGPPPTFWKVPAFPLFCPTQRPEIHGMEGVGEGDWAPPALALRQDAVGSSCHAWSRGRGQGGPQEKKPHLLCSGPRPQHPTQGWHLGAPPNGY